MGWWFYFQVVGTPHHYMYQSNFFLPQVVGTLKPSIISLCAISPLFCPPVSPLFHPNVLPLFCPLCCSLTSCPSWRWGPYIVAFWWGHYNLRLGGGVKQAARQGVTWGGERGQHQMVVGTLYCSILVGTLQPR